MNLSLVSNLSQEEVQQRKATFSEHSKSSVHIAQCKLEHVHEKVKTGEANQDPQMIDGYLNPIQPYTDKVLQRRINSAHFVAKENRAATKYEELMVLQQKNGLDLGSQHLHEYGYRIYSSLIAVAHAAQLKAEIAGSKFFGVLSDGSPGKHDLTEHEAVYTRFISRILESLCFALLGFMPQNTNIIKQLLVQSKVSFTSLE